MSLEERLRRLEERNRRLEGEVKELRGEGAESEPDEMDRILAREAKEDKSADPLGRALHGRGDLTIRSEEEEAAAAIRKFDGTPADYSLKQFQQAFRFLNWPSQYLQHRLEGAAKREKESGHALK